MIRIKDVSSPNCVPISDAHAADATSVKLDGHCYIIIKNGDSQNTKLHIDGRNVALLNIKSRGIRAVDYSTLVEVVNLDIVIDIP